MRGDAEAFLDLARDAQLEVLDEPPGLQQSLGRALRRAGDLPGSALELESALALAPELAWIAFELAATRLAGGDRAGALAAVSGLMGYSQ